MQLLPHQIEDAQFLAEREFAGCFSGMGSGKTLTALQAARLLGAAKVKQSTRVLIIAPPIALRMWEAEAHRHLHNPVQLVKTGKTLLDGQPIKVCSYQIATARAVELQTWLSGGVLICDESHALKSLTAKRTKAILGRGGIATGAGHAWMLTGTPSTRWNDDLYPFLCRADLAGMKERCGGVTLERFQLRYTVRQKKQFANMRFPVWMTVGNQRTEELGDWIYKGGLAVRRELADVWAAMPPITKTRYTIDLDAAVMGAEIKAQLKKIEKMTVSQIEQLRQDKDPALATIRRAIGMGKVKAAVEEILDRLEGGQRPILVGAWHTDVIDALVEALSNKGYMVVGLDGRTSAARKAVFEDMFNAGKLDVLVGQISAMGVSLNLQKGGAHYIIVVEEDWSPAVMDQFYARLHRMGQEHHVQVDTLVADLKIEQAVGRISGAKAKGHDQLAASAG